MILFSGLYNMKHSFLIFSLLIILILNGCRKADNLNDLHSFIAKIAKQEVLPIKPLPEFLYKAGQLNEAFKENKKNSNNNVILANYSISAIHLLGVIASAKQRWALISTSDGKVFKIRDHDIISEQTARVKKITISQVIFDNFKIKLNMERVVE